MVNEKYTALISIASIPLLQNALASRPVLATMSNLAISSLCFTIHPTENPKLSYLACHPGAFFVITALSGYRALVHAYSAFEHGCSSSFFKGLGHTLLTTLAISGFGNAMGYSILETFSQMPNENSNGIKLSNSAPVSS